MATASTSTAIAAIEPVSPSPSGSPWLGSWPVTPAWPARPARWTCASTRAGAPSISCACSRRAAPTSSASPATWKPAAAPGPPSPAGCAPLPGSATTPSRRSCSITPQPLMSAVPGWTMSRMSPAWTATNSARCWSPPARPARRARAHLAAGLNGLRVCEATGANIECLGVERGHRTLVVTRKGGKTAAMPQSPPPVTTAGLLSASPPITRPPRAIGDPVATLAVPGPE